MDATTERPITLRGKCRATTTKRCLDGQHICNLKKDHKGDHRCSLTLQNDKRCNFQWPQRKRTTQEQQP